MGKRARAGSIVTAALAGLLAVTAVAAAEVTYAPATAGPPAVTYVSSGPVGLPDLLTGSAGVSCPAGTGASGGTFQVPERSIGEVFAFASGPSGEGWEVSAGSASNLTQASVEAVASCLPAALLAGEEVASASAKLDARLKPRGHDEKTVVARCKPGMEVLAGGFEGGGPHPQNIVPSVSAPNAEGSGWTVTAKNFTELQSAEISASAICIPRQVAQGLIGLHSQRTEAKIEEGTIASSCTLGGRALGGGFSTSSNNAAFENMPFSANHLGFEALYDSHALRHDRVALTVICGEAVSELGPLTAADFNHFCEAEEGPTEAIHGEQASEWKCAPKPEPPPQGSGGEWNLAGRFGEVCRVTYRPGQASQPRAVYANIADPLSWRCYEPESQALAARPLLGGAGAPGGPLGNAGGPSGRAIAVRGTVRLPHRLRLAGTSVGVRNLLLERSARGELVRRRGGRDAAPLSLRPRPAGAPHGADLYAGGRHPRVTLELRQRGRRLRFDLSIVGGQIREPLLCPGGGQTELTTRFVILRGTRRLADIELDRPWRCAGARGNRRHRQLSARFQLPVAEMVARKGPG